MISSENRRRSNLRLNNTVMGLGNAVFNELKRVVLELGGDQERNVEQKVTLKGMYEKKDELDIIFSNYNLDKMILINDSERVEAFPTGDTKGAKKVTLANYDPYNSKKTAVQKCAFSSLWTKKTDMLISSNV